MKKALLVSSILLAAAGCSVEQGDLADVQAEAVRSRSDLVDQVFVSKETFKTTKYRWDEATRTSTPYEVEVKLRLKFIRAQNYTLDDKQRGLDYEVVVEEFVEATGETFSRDFYYFARKTSSTKYQVFDCDSTRKCHTEFGNSSMKVYQTCDGTKALTVQQGNNFFLMGESPALEFVAAPQ